MTRRPSSRQDEPCDRAAPRGQQNRTDATQRFSGRAEIYARYRPRYPAAVIEVLRQETGLTGSSRIADIGSGTGISSELFLRHGNRVYGVEPNREMRETAESLLSRYPLFHSVDGSAEATTMPSRSVDYVVAAQAFHWFDAPKTRREWARILRAGGWVVLLWNSRRVDASPFMRAYEGLLRHYGTDYQQVHHGNIDAGVFKGFFAGGRHDVRMLSNEQRFDFKGLRGRLLSSSYAPGEGHPSHATMLEALERLFERHENEGQVRFEYDTEVHFGRVA